MDKRILKTKKALKEAMLSLLNEKNFDRITATEICERAIVSRNTFYSYYPDKYALLEECFSDYEDEFLRRFNLKQSGHPSSDMKENFLDLVETFFETENLNRNVPILSNFDLMELYYRSTMNILKKYEEKYADCINPAYDMEQLNSFLALGFWGFIHGNHKMNRDEIQSRTRTLMIDLLKCPIFR